MTVAELIRKLSKFNPKAEVILSSDSEGNHFRRVEDITEGLLWEEGHIVKTVEFSDRPEGDGIEGAQRAICLWP